MKNSKGNAVITTILVIVILLLVGFIVYDKVLLKKNNVGENLVEVNKNVEEQENQIINNTQKEEVVINKENKTNNNKYTYNEIEGMYKFLNEDVSYTLYLWENGTFIYEFVNNYYPSGVIGNYTIVDNKVLLNYMFTTGSDASLYVKKGNHTLIINSENKLTDKSTELEQRSIELNKTTTDEKFVNSYNFYNLTDTYVINKHLD